MATISNTPRPGYVWDSTDNVWYPIGVGGHGHPDYITQATAVNPTIIDAKGDILTATAADTPARLAVGNNGETLVADSSTSTGLRYQTGVNLNGVIGGGFDWWQRGTSFTVAASTTTYTADRWTAFRAATGLTVTRQSSGLTGFNYCSRIQRDSGNTSTTLIQYGTNFETIQSIPFAGQTVTLSFYARKGANYSQASSALNVQLITGTGTDQNYLSGFTGGVAVIDSSATLTTTWTRFTFTIALASTVTQLASNLYFVPVGTAGAADYVEVTGVQLEMGSVATTFKRAGGTLQGELDACQRYFFDLATGINKVIGPAFMYGATQADATVAFPTSMRTAPTLVLTGGTNYFRFDRTGASDDFDTMTIYIPSTNTCLLYVTSGISGTSGDAGYWFTNNAAASVAFSAEL